MNSRILFFTTFFAGSLAAQQPQPTSPPGQDTSLAARLERAERLLQLLREQVNQQAAARVEPRSGNHVELSGLVLVNGFFNNARVNNSDVPQIVLPPDATVNLPASHGGATARQSQVALTATVPEFAGGAFHGELDLDFFGGQQPSPGGRTWPLVRLRRVRAEIEWPHGWVMFGQEAPPIAEINPSSLAQIGLVGFARSGNLWLWLPQVRAGAEVGSTVKIGVEGSALAPTAGDPQGVGLLFTQPDRAERSRRPHLEGRLRIRWDEPESSGEISLGGHYGWLAKGVDTLVVSRAVVASARFTATQYLELQGEVFTGQALAGLGGGGIGQNLGPGIVPVRSRGGWAQLNLRPHPAIEVGGGYGLDDPDDADLDPATALLRNLSWEGHVQWRPAPLVLGVEFRRIETTYGPAVGALFAHHVNAAAGFEF
ncbi:MAG: hypothetical protein HYT81_12510 [Gemmatimonadetes bacterium]|nr:hypothetical protein [Gemmatimonadota bacterium]